VFVDARQGAFLERMEAIVRVPQLDGEGILVDAQAADLLPRGCHDAHR
jgi:hypothetical protein